MTDYALGTVELMGSPITVFKLKQQNSFRLELIRGAKVIKVSEGQQDLLVRLSIAFPNFLN